ncbi:hypothetical protein [Algoriphagus chordae]|uniref:Uncharacterized protein n=1 Tax=Algoriphagus chordae TaxID=237019 RepID=A0A2W7SDM8_9BACT|nr:hypothetical protein [Algoriphagus chordae]PZX48732.1 hypothetical protein LV85_03547 [Algoriphagus chordae]
MKKVLVIHYSQSGQLTEILGNVTQPLLGSDEVEITQLKLEMENEYPFPWPRNEFYGVFPETFLQLPSKLKPIPKEILDGSYDLVILGYQVWYLTPSGPTNSFLMSPEAKKLLGNRPVITVIGCRNMWIMAQEKVKKLLKSCDAQLVGNIALVDRHINHISVITIAQWMFTGVKKRFLGIFPKPGVDQKDIDEATRFGKVILPYLKSAEYNTLQNELLNIGAVNIKPFLITVDKRANVIFRKWANLIHSKSRKGDDKRSLLINLFSFYLQFAIWVMAPIAFMFYLLTYIPFMGKINKEKQYYLSVENK